MRKFDIPFSREEVKSFSERRLEIRLSPPKDGDDDIVIQGWYKDCIMAKSNLHSDGGEPAIIILDTGGKVEKLEEFSVLEIKDYSILA